MIKRLGYQTLWRLGLIGLLALTTAACGRDSDQSAPPVTEPTASFTQQVAGLTVSLDASGSTGDIASYQWDFGDGSSGVGKTVSHTYAAVGDYSVVLTVTDSAGESTQKIAVVRPILLGTLRGVAVYDLLAGSTIQVFGYSSDTPSAAELGQSLTDSSGQFQVSFTLQDQTFYRVVLEGGTFPDGRAFLGRMEAVCSISETSCNLSPYSTLVASLLDPQQPPAVQLSLASQRLTQILGIGSDPFIRELHQEPVLDVNLSAWRQQFANGQDLNRELQNLALDIADGYLEPSANGIFPNGKYQAVNKKPTAAFTHSETDLAASFDASTSSDSDGSIASYSWSFGDGATGSGKTASHSYTAAGTYTVTLTVTDDKGATASQSTSVSVVAPNVAPTAAFTHNKTDLLASFDASTSSDSDGSIASYSWSFGDGATGTGKSASHSYAAAGTYTVTLTVTDDKGATASQSASLSVVAPNVAPTAAFTHSETDLLASFDASTASDSDGSIASYSWSFGDGATGTGKSASHSYAAAGTYTVTLTVTDNQGASANQSASVIVVAPNVAPTAAFTHSETDLLASFDASTSSDSDGSIASYSWSFGDGTTGTGKTASHSYTAAGTYSVTLTVTDDKGATASQSVSVSVVAPNVAPTAAFTHSETDLLASFDASTASDSDGSIASYSWSFGDGATGTGKSASHSYAVAGTYSVTLTVTDDKGATASQSVSLSVVAPNVAPTAAFTHSKTDLLASFDASTASDSDGSIASYSWSFGDGATGTGKSASHSYAAAGTYTVTLTVTDNQGASANQSASVSVVAPNVAPTAAFTHSETYLLASFDASTASDSDGSIASYSWSFGDGATGTGKSASHSYAVAGTYSVTLTVTDDKGATASQSVSLSVVAPNVAPTAAFTHSKTDLLASFDASTASDSDGSIASYSWSFGDGATGTGKSASHSYAAAGTYTVTLTVTDNQGASANQSASVSVVAPNVAPTAAFTHSETYLLASFDASTASDSDGSIASYSWSFGDGTTGTGKSASHSYAASGTYTVTLTVTDDRGGEHSLSQSITVDNRIAAVATGKLNDTGITTCADASSWSLPCPVAGFPGQDAESGRDVSANDDSDGHAGFGFTKVSSSGEALAASAAEWSCVKDNVTGLLWELHTDDGGLRDKDNTYSWYNPDATTNGGAAGTQNGGICSGGISCDTQGYVTAVNAAGLCGYHDWRLPTLVELQGLVDYSIPEPSTTIDTNFFPDTQQNGYWSSSAVAGYTDGAWYVYFYGGNTNGGSKAYYKQLRLVRNEP